MAKKKDESNDFLNDFLKNHTESLRIGTSYYMYLNSYILLDTPTVAPMTYVLIDYVTLYILPLLGCDDGRLKQYRERLLAYHEELLSKPFNSEEAKSHLDETKEGLKEFGVNFNLNMDNGEEQKPPTNLPQYTKEQLKDMIEHLYSYDEILDIFTKKKKKDDENKGKKK